MTGRRIRIAALAFTLSTGVYGVGVAHAENDVAQGCKAVKEAGLMTQGACVSLAKGNSTAFLSGLCKLEGADETFGNHGQCLKALRSAAP